MDDLSLSDKIKRIRQKHQLNQAQMADKMGMSEQSYGRWEREDRRITVFQLEKFAKKLGIKVSDIIKSPESVSMHDNMANENTGENSVQNGSAAFFIVNNYSNQQANEEITQIENENLKKLLDSKEQQLADKEKLVSAQNQQIALLQELLEQLKKSSV